MVTDIRNRINLIAISTIIAGMPVAAQQVNVAQEGVIEALVEQAEKTRLDVETLDAYAQSIVAIRRIQVRAAGELSTLHDEQERYDSEQRAKSEMIEAVLETGISVDEYQHVSQLMNALPELREAIMQRVTQWLEGA